MARYVTLGADESGEVYGLELGEDGKWKRNSLGLSTSCAVIRPVSKETYEYVTKDPESARDIWQACVAAGNTELGLKEWFNGYVAGDDLFDTSFVFELLDDEHNPTVAPFGRSDANDGTSGFRKHVAEAIVQSSDCIQQYVGDDICKWECSGWFSPERPFVVEFAPKELLEEYYEHLRQTKEGFGAK